MANSTPASSQLLPFLKKTAPPESPGAACASKAVTCEGGDCVKSLQKACVTLVPTITSWGAAATRLVPQRIALLPPQSQPLMPFQLVAAPRFRPFPIITTCAPGDGAALEMLSDGRGGLVLSLKTRRSACSPGAVWKPKPGLGLAS